MTRRRARADGGFTLIEVLIAVAVLAIALGASLDALNVFSDTQVRLRERYLGHLTAWNVMTDYRNEQLQTPAAAGGGFASLSTEGSEEQGGSVWQWSLQKKERRQDAAEEAPAESVAIVVVDVYSPAAAARRGSPPSATLQAIFGE